jgi:hypothetical protein
MDATANELAVVPRVQAGTLRGLSSQALAMNEIESNIVAFIKQRHAEGALSVQAPEIMEAIVPRDRPTARYRTSYFYALDRLLRRLEINAVDAADGTRHFFIGDYPSPGLRESLGI